MKKTFFLLLAGVIAIVTGFFILFFENRKLVRDLEGYDEPAGDVTEKEKADEPGDD